MGWPEQKVDQSVEWALCFAPLNRPHPYTMLDRQILFSPLLPLVIDASEGWLSSCGPCMRSTWNPLASLSLHVEERIVPGKPTLFSSVILRVSTRSAACTHSRTVFPEGSLIKTWYLPQSTLMTVSEGKAEDGWGVFTESIEAVSICLPSPSQLRGRMLGSYQSSSLRGGVGSHARNRDQVLLSHLL